MENYNKSEFFGNKSEGKPSGYNTIFKLASLTKPITALVTLKLVEQGLWNLDEPIYKYYIDKDIKDSSLLKKLTTRHILTHQSGFTNWRHLTDSERLTFEREPGTQFQYSGEGYEYLRKALEVKLNKRLEDLASELLFNPLNMSNTHFYWDSTLNESNYAIEHNEFGEELQYKKHITANAAANLLTTVKYYGVFMTHIIKGAELSDTLFNQFITPYSKKQEGVHWAWVVKYYPN
jgi:CubicO group peptidase (beta-lactamase class C family)